MHRLTFTQPDDWHLHLRDGAFMASIVMATARCFNRAIIMPNLKSPITTVEQAMAYRKRITAAIPSTCRFNPLMTLYLTDNTPTSEIAKAKKTETVIAVKYYPAGATTHSESGVTDLRHVWSVLETMQTYDLPLLIHGEVTADSIDVFDREKIFIEYVLDPLLANFPALRVVLEHITTAEAVEYVSAMGNHNLAATISAHHLLMNRNDLFKGGIRPHHYCLPVLKRETHRQALLQAATSGNPKFFLGTDSAPHAQSAKETTCGCAGIYTAPAALELYAEAFEQAQALDKLEGFASFYGADFYHLPRNTQTVTLEKRTWQMPTHFQFGDTQVVPLRAGAHIYWQQVQHG
jgi:dihydroorotase